MNKFKFFQNNKIKSDWVQRSWFPTRLLGQLQWLTQPVGVIYYKEISMENGFYRENLKSTTFQIYSRYMNSYNHFMEMNSDKVIFAYEFIDNTNIRHMIQYNHQNFDDMPKDSPLIFRGIIRPLNVFE